MVDEEPKIIVDSDWKQEAQEEKQRLEREAKEAESMGPLPNPTFLEIVNMLSMQAIIGLGGMNMPDGKQIPPDLNVAKHHVDLLEILQQKTKGQLDQQEENILNATLHELRMGYVQAATPASGTGESDTSG